MKVKKFLLWLVISLFLVRGSEVTFSQTNFWQPTNGPYGGSITTLAINSKGDIFAGSPNGVFFSTDHGDHWTLLTTIATSSLVINSKGDIFAGGLGVYRSVDNGANWVHAGLQNMGVTALARNSNEHIFAGTYDGVFQGGIYRSTDNGDNWTGTDVVDRVYSLAIDSSNNIFAGVGGIQISFIIGVMRSTDNGDTWKAVGLTFLEVDALAFNSDGHIFAGTFRGVFRSTDKGENWTQVNNGLTDTRVGPLAINSGGHIFAGTDGGGAYRSTDNGDSWIEINSGIMDNQVTSLAVNSDDYIFAGTASGVIFRSVEPTTAVKEIGEEIHTSFVLEQNYPNPCNPTTTIQFTLPRSGYVTLKVYNTLGAEVATLVAGNLSAGGHTVEWNADGMADGVYLYRLKTGEFVQTKKLVMIK